MAGTGGKRRRDAEEMEADWEDGVGNTEDTDWRETAARIRREQRRGEAVKRRRGGEEGVT